MDKLIVTLVGLAGIAFTYWFFLMKKEEAVEVGEEVDITVDGGYTPEVISVPKGKPMTLNFFRQDPSACLEEVIIPDFHIRKFLPVNKKTAITINPTRTGEFSYACGMNMFHGKILVKE